MGEKYKYVVVPQAMNLAEFCNYLKDHVPGIDKEKCTPVEMVALNPFLLKFLTKGEVPDRNFLYIPTK